MLPAFRYGMLHTKRGLWTMQAGTQASKNCSTFYLQRKVGVTFCERKKVGDLVSFFVPLTMFPRAQGAYLVYSMLKVVPSEVLKAATG